MEFKGKNYSLFEIQEQLQNCLDNISRITGRYNRKFTVVPVFYAPSHKQNIDRWCLSFNLLYMGEKVDLKYLTDNEDVRNSIP